MDASNDHTWGPCVDHLLSHFFEPSGITRRRSWSDYPVELSPFAKHSAGDRAVVERFEAFATSSRSANGYSELNDPLDQRARFVELAAARAAGDPDTHPMDLDYLLALVSACLRRAASASASTVWLW